MNAMPTPNRRPSVRAFARPVARVMGLIGAVLVVAVGATRLAAADWASGGAGKLLPPPPGVRGASLSGYLPRSQDGNLRSYRAPAETAKQAATEEPDRALRPSRNVMDLSRLASKLQAEPREEDFADAGRDEGGESWADDWDSDSEVWIGDSSAPPANLTLSGGRPQLEALPPDLRLPPEPAALVAGRNDAGRGNDESGPSPVRRDEPARSTGAASGGPVVVLLPREPFVRDAGEYPIDVPVGLLSRGVLLPRQAGPVAGVVLADATGARSRVVLAAAQVPLELQDPGAQPPDQKKPPIFSIENPFLEESDEETAGQEANRPAGQPAAGATAEGREQTLGESQRETVTEATEQRNLRFLRQESILLDPGEYEFDFTVQYLVDEADYVLARVEDGNLQIGEAVRRQRLLTLPLELRVGLSSNTQGFVNVPFGWSNSEFSFLNEETFSNSGGIGDVSAGVVRQILEGDECSPAVLGIFAFSAPTGKADVATALSTPGSSLGEGYWTLTAGLTFIRTYDPVVIFYGGGYRHRFDRTFDDEIAVSPGQQAFYRLGIGYAINTNVTLSASFQGSYIAANKVNGVRIAGGIQEPMLVRLAATIARNKRCKPHSCLTTVEPYVNFGITEDAVDSLFGISWTF